MPDLPAFAQRSRHRRPPEAPRVELPLWVKAISRRVEAQLKRDWMLGFAQYNLMFRNAINLTKQIYSYESPKNADGTAGFTAAELEEAAISICNALVGKYQDPQGRWRPVNGDMTKVRFVPGMTPAALRSGPGEPKHVWVLLTRSAKPERMSFVPCVSCTMMTSWEAVQEGVG